MTQPVSTECVRDLIEPTRVHGSLYTSEEIFQIELEQIWYRGWVYVGHESEVPDAGMFVSKSIGPQPLIMTRANDGQVHVLHNRCSHRGNLVCMADSGSTNSFRCPFHGWNFALDGSLLGYPHPEGYGGRHQLDDLPLPHVARTEAYEGFVFASLADDGPSLIEHLGDAADGISRLVSLSPERRLDLRAGWLQHRAHANWKLIVENETDGYHPQFVHGSIFSVGDSRIGDLYGEHSAALTRDFGNGHSENDLRPEFRKNDAPMWWFGSSEERVPEYAAAMRRAYGDDEARRIMVDGSPHVMVFPNLFIAEITLFVLQPLSVGVTVQHSTALQLAGAGELNRKMLHQCIGSAGPAGMLLADDTEMYERNQEGLGSREPAWIDTRRGLHRESQDSDGHPIGSANDEIGIRGFWRHYSSLVGDVELAASTRP